MGCTMSPTTVSRHDPRYWDLSYWPTPDTDQSWTDARREQMAAIEARATEFWLDSRPWATPDPGHWSRPTKSRQPHRAGTQPAPRARQNLNVGAIVTPERPVWQSFTELVPARPYCTDYLGALQIQPREFALRRRYVQLNGPAAYMWLPFDVDRPAAIHVALDWDVPQPTFVAVNPESTHAHVAYLLRAPVTNFAESRGSPLHYLAAVQRGLRRRLGADRAYNGLIVQNPQHKAWLVDWPGPAYDLGQLADWLDRKDMRPEPRRERETGIGRNCEVFDDTRDWAYRAVLAFKRDGGTQEAWRERCRKIAGAHNSVFAVPMLGSEVRTIGKSIADWTWRKFSDAQFSRIQSFRGQRGNAKRWAGHLAESTTKPWETMGISERTYYRRKKAGRL